MLSDSKAQSRTGYPLRLGYAMTIHKSQGQTLGRVVLDVGNNETSLGLTYVGASRVKHYSRIAIVAHEKERYDKIGRSESMQPRLTEEERLDRLAIETLITL